MFSVLVSLVPSIGMGWYFYTVDYTAMAEKTELRLIETSGKVESDVDLWLKERDQDLHIIATSSAIVDNLSRYQAMADKTDVKEKENQSVFLLKKITNYLNFLRNQNPDYRRLAVFDGEGRQVADSEISGEDRSFALPDGWEARMAASKAVIGEPYQKKNEAASLIVVGIPLVSGRTGGRLGVLAVEVRLQGLQPYLQTVPANENTGPWTVLLVQKDGRPIVSASSPEGQQETALTANQKSQLLAGPLHLRTYNNGKWIVGLAASFKELPWGLVIAESYDHVFADVIRSRDRIILAAIVVTLFIGLCASLIVVQILPPLEALRRGALQVAGGEFDVELDVRKSDELGSITGIFNEMVARLKQNRQELERLAVTDPLTLLANRKQIMTTLKSSIEYYKRYSAEFALLLIDIDHFKSINEKHGHLMGDVVLVQLAEILNNLLRTMDTAGRYEGGKFLVILGQTTLQGAMPAAQRIRQAVENTQIMYQDIELHITISIGVTGVVSVDDTDNSLIGRADKALLEAKSGGRNRVALSSEHPSAGPAQG